ncbi:MAG: tyrosine-type recombinase/integrase [Alphaproteobacteria bacterium]
MTRNLVQQGHTWYVRYVVPTKWRKIVGKSAIVRTLKTRDLDEANRRKHGKLDEIIRQVEAQVFQRTGSNSEAVAALNELLEAPDEERQDIYTEIIADRAEDIAERGHDTEAHRYYEIATGKGVPLSTVRDEWLKSLEGQVTAGTIDGRRHAVNTFVDAMGDRMMNKITPRVATKWLSDHLEPSGRSPRTLGRYIGALDLMWKWARRREYCDGLSPFSGLTGELKKTKRRKRAFSDEELKTFLEALKRKQNSRPEEYDIGLLLVESGCRLNEICELRVRDVHDGGEVHIKDAKTQSGNRVVFFLSERSQEILERRTIGKRPDDQLFEELRPGGQDQKLGHSVSKRMRATLAEAIPEAKAQGLDLHSIRRWAATVLENIEDIDPVMKDRMMGHSSGKLLTDIYSSGPEKRRLKLGFEAYAKSMLHRIF